MICDQQVTKLDASFDRRVLTLQGAKEAEAWRRIFPEFMPATHRLEYKWLNAFNLQIQVVELPLDEIAAKSDSFESVDLPVLRALVEKHKIPVNVERSDNPDDKKALVHALREYTKTLKPAAPAAPPVPTIAVIPVEISAMDEANLATRAVELEVVFKRGWNRKQKENAVAAAHLKRLAERTGE